MEEEIVKYFSFNNVTLKVVVNPKTSFVNCEPLSDEDLVVINYDDCEVQKIPHEDDYEDCEVEKIPHEDDYKDCESEKIPHEEFDNIVKNIENVIEKKEVFGKDQIMKILGSLEAETNISLEDWYQLLTLRRFPFYRNFLKNSNGENKLNDWEFIQVSGNNREWEVEYGGLPSNNFQMETFWKEEEKSVSSDESCFLVKASSEYFAKEQIIDLENMNLIPAVLMDECKPKIVYQDWYHRGNRMNSYKLTVSLLDAKKQELCYRIHFHEAETKPGPVVWEKIVDLFEKYPKGVRYIRFKHGGFGKGGYPLRIANSWVYLVPYGHEACDNNTEEINTLTSCPT
uniref:F-box only protein 2 n=1 Tax=Cacopsylla melanoneura TaxID=428564 RepID=A0A8D8RZL3_9HEMI